MSHRSLIVVPLIALACLVGCSRHGTDDVLRLALQTEPSTLDPAFSADFASGRVSSLIHSTLVAFDPDGKIIPDLAGRWEVSDGARSYLFHLREAHFSNGRRVVAGDVVYSFQRLLDPATASPRWWLLAAVRGASAFHERTGPRGRVAVSASDDSTVAIALEAPVAHFASLLAMPAAGVVCREEVERLGQQYGRTPCGSGPWKLAAWQESDEIDLVPNPGSSGGAPSIAGISIRIIPEPMTQIAEFEAGNLDVLEVPRAELEHWRTAGVTLLSREELRVAYIGLNTRKPPFNDVRVRQAVNMAVDVEKIIVHVLFGGGSRARGVVPPALRGSPEPADGYPYNPARARELLAEAGYPNGLDVEIWQRENPEGGRVLESIQGYLGAVGAYYQNFPPISDEEVIELLEQAKH